MKLFKILMWGIIAFVFLVIVAGSISGCSVLKKARHKTTVKSDSTAFARTIDSFHRSTGTLQTGGVTAGTSSGYLDTYDRETVVEDFAIPATIEASDYLDTGLFLTGPAADAFWKREHGLLKKRTTVRERGTLSVQETEHYQARDSVLNWDSLMATRGSVQSGTVKKETVAEEKNKSVKKAFPGWGAVVLILFLFAALVYYLRRQFYLF